MRTQRKQQEASYRAWAQFIAESEPRIEEADLYRSLIAREKISPTGWPRHCLTHCKLPTCSGIVGALVTLSEPIEFEAIDDEPVSTLFYVVVPERQTDQHLAVLSMLMKRFNDPHSDSGFGKRVQPGTLFSCCS